MNDKEKGRNEDTFMNKEKFFLIYISRILINITFLIGEALFFSNKFLFFPPQLNGATFNAKTTLTPGGVGRNLAEGLYKLNGSVSFISAFGNDSNGEYLRKSLPPDATANSCKISNDVASSSCAIILDKNGDCKLHVGDLNIHRLITPEVVSIER